MAVKDSMDAILARLDSMENTIVNLQHEVTSANLRAENAELKLQLSVQEKHKEIKQKPLGKGKNRSNSWLDEIVFYTPPRSYDPKELYCDGAVNGKHWRLIRNKANPVPRYVAQVFIRRENSENELNERLNGMARDFENAYQNDFKDNSR